MTTILIVEDDQTSVLLIKAALAPLTITLFIATTGQQGLDCYRDQPTIDLILMDLHLPDMDGFTVTDTIRRSPHYLEHPIPIVAITANSLMESRDNFLKTTGLSDYVTKPLTRDRLDYIIKRYITKS